MKSAQFIFTHISRMPQIIFQLPNNTIFAWKKLSAKNRYILLVAVFASFLIFIPIALSTLLNSNKAEAAWWNDSWGYRQTVNITNSGSAQTDYQVAITLDTATLITAGKMRSDCNDIRVTDVNGNILPHWIEGGAPGCNNAATEIWVKVSSIPTSGQTLFIYYGNSSAVNVENPNKLFLLFDDFKNVDAGKWTDTTGTNTIVSSGYDNQAVNTKSDDNDIRYYSKAIFSGGYSVKARMREDGTDGGIFFDALNDANGYLVTSRRGGGVNAFQWYKRAAGAWSNISLISTVSSWTSTEFRTLEVTRIGTNISVKDNETAITYDLSTDASYSSGGVGIRGSSEQTIDWIFVKKAITTEPTVNSPTNEEKSQGPVAYWKFDEGTGTTTKDSSSKGHNASLVSGTTWTAESECISGKCLKFDGVDDYVAMGTGSNYFPMDTFSLCAWIKTPGLASGMSTNGIISLTYGLVMWLDSNGHLVSMLDNGTSAPTITETTVNLADNKWHYVCTSYNSTNQYLYIDGLQKTSAARTWLGTTRWPTNGANVGHNNNNPPVTKFNGFIDEVKIYNYARSAAQIKLDYTSRGSVKGASSSIGNDLVRQGSLANGLVGYWKQDEATWSGTLNEVVDSSGNGNHGQAQGATGGKAYPATGKFGSGGYFDGVDDYVDVGAGTSITTNTNTTISTWVKPSVNNIWQRALSKGEYNTSGWLIGITNTGKADLTVVRNDNSSYVATYGLTTLQAGQWYHIVGVVDTANQSAKIYVNGVLDNIASNFPTTIKTGADTVKIGKSGAGYFFNGQIDEARIYNRALSPAEVQKLYSYAPGPVAYYDFEEGQGSTLNDKSGNGYTGTITGPIWNSGKYGKSLKFTGANYVDVGSGPTDFNNNWTISFWANDLNQFSTAAGLVTKTNGGSYWNNKGVSITHISNPQTIYINISDGTTHKTANTGIGPNYSWTYLTLTKNNTTAYLYANGVIISTIDLTGLGDINGSQNLFIGKGNGAGYFGLIDEVKIYNYARTLGQIIEDMNANHPVGGSPIGSQLLYLKLDEGYSSISKSQVNGYTFDHFNSPTWISDGKFGKAIDFDGLNDHLRAGSSDPFEYRGGDYTISTWFYPHSGDTDGGWIISKPWNGSGQYNYTLKHNSDKTITLGLVGATGWTGTTTKTITINSWHYIAATIEDSTKSVKIYFDGVLVYSGTHTITDWTPSSGDTNVPLSIGCLYPYGTWVGNTTHCVKGKIDEVKIYNTTLTAEQIKLDYNQGKSMVLGSFGTDSDGITASNSASRIYCVPGDTSTCNPPVAEWNFEEKQGNTANDTSGNGNNGTLTNSPTWTQGKTGSALSFNGSNTYISGTNNSSVQLTTGTVQAWIKTSNPGSSYRGIVTKQSAYGMFLNNNEFGIYDWGGTGWKGSGQNLNDGKWHLVAFSFISGSANGTTFYVDGQNKGTTIMTVSNQNVPLVAGAGNNGASQVFTGIIDQVRVFNYVRSPAQIAWDYNQGKPVGHWKLDECQGTTAGDSSGNGNNGTINIGGTGTQTSAGTCQTSGTAWYNGQNGKYDSSLNFDGTDDYTYSTSFPALGIGKPFSISAWFKTSATYAYSPGIISLGYSPVIVMQSDGKLRGWWYNGSTWPGITTTKSYKDGSFHHTTLTYDGTTVKIYVDGRLEGSLDSNVNAIYSGFYVGIERNSGNKIFNGQIDDTRVYNYALTPYQVKQLMNQGAAVRWGPVTGAP